MKSKINQIWFKQTPAALISVTDDRKISQLLQLQVKLIKLWSLNLSIQFVCLWPAIRKCLMMKVLRMWMMMRYPDNWLLTSNARRTDSQHRSESSDQSAPAPTLRAGPSANRDHVWVWVSVYVGNLSLLGIGRVYVTIIQWKCIFYCIIQLQDHEERKQQPILTSLKDLYLFC